MRRSPVIFSSKQRARRLSVINGSLGTRLGEGPRRILGGDAHGTSALREDADQTQDGQSAPASELLPQPGMSIAGRFRLEEKLGEGGMGEVWVAQQLEPIKRRVALKLIKLGMDSRAIDPAIRGCSDKHLR